MSATAARPDTAGLAVRRVLAAFNPATASIAALENASDLAARLGAELEVLFIEDEGLLGLAELPFVRQASLHGGTGGPFVRAQIESEVRALALRLERSLGSLAARLKIGSSFRMVRGRPAASILAAAEGVDLLIVGASARPIGREQLLEASLPELVGRTTCPVLVLRVVPLRRGPIHVLLETEQAPGRVLAVATDLAERYATTVVVTTEGDEGEKIERAFQGLGRAPGVVRRQVAAATGPARIEALLAGIEDGILVLDATRPEVCDPATWRQLARAPCGILLIR